MTSRILRTAATFAVAALLLTSCSAGSGAPDSPGGPEGEPIKIGFAMSKTGFASEINVPADGVVNAWTEWVNAAGGIDGHPVDVITRDTAATPTTGLTVVKQLVEQDEVSAIMVLDAISEGAVKDYLAAADIAVIEVHAYDTTLFGTIPNYFGTSPSDTYSRIGYVEGAAAAGGGSIGMAVCAEAPSCALVDHPTAELAPLLDMEYNGTVKVSGSQPSFTAECLNFINSDTDWIGLGLASATSLRVMSDCATQGYEGGYALAGGAVTGELMDQQSGVPFAGLLVNFPWWVDAEPVNEFRDVMAKYSPDTRIDGVVQTGTWAALELFRKAVTGSASDGLTRAQVLEAFGKVKDETLGGLLPTPVTYTAGEASEPISCYWLYSHTGGEDDYQTFPPDESANGADGELASTCYDGPPIE